MKKRITAETMQKSFLLPQVQQKGWSLCVGAGISIPIFPSWNELVSLLMQQISPNISHSAIDELQSKFSPDTLIQAAWAMSGNEDFSQLLSDILYRNLKSKINIKQWDRFRKLFTITHSTFGSDDAWKEFIKISNTLFSQTTAYNIAKLIADSNGTLFAPKSILSFNAEPLLYSLINAFVRQKYIETGQTHHRHDMLQLMTKSTSSYSNEKIPYYFCHGALLNNIATKYKKEYDAESKMVFSEAQYLNMANNYSWQSISFLDACLKSTVIFVGVSLTDSNMRKWLNSIQKERSLDIAMPVDSTQHFWIEREPQNKESMDWMEASVHHLGVRIVWIKDWKETASVISKMIGFYDQGKNL